MSEITLDEYNQAVSAEKSARKTIDAYHEQERKRFEKRLKDNPVFHDHELIYSRSTLCCCGYGIAYPKGCGPDHYWDCSGILRGIADPNVLHSGKLPFAFYEIKSEREGQTTRGVFKPQQTPPTTDPQTP